MSKKEKHKFTSTSKKKVKNIPFKSKSKQISLKERLRRVYEDTVNLNTTCKCTNFCCRVAMPQMNYCEFSQLINEIWGTSSKSEKIEFVCKSIEYFFRHEFEKWGMESLVKKCMLLSKNGKCSYYESRPLSCRIYGLWPKKEYNERVDKFEKAYKGLLKRKDLPLNVQCKNVKRVDDSKELTIEVINDLFAQLDKIDDKIGDFSDVQLEQKENYRTFHDWILLKTYGEDWLITLTSFMMAAKKEDLVDLVEQLKVATRQNFAKEVPDLRI